MLISEWDSFGHTDGRTEYPCLSIARLVELPKLFLSYNYEENKYLIS